LPSYTDKKEDALQIDGDKVRELRERLLLTQTQLGERAGLSLYTVSSVERGAHSATFKTARALAKALGVEPEELMRPLALAQR